MDRMGSDVVSALGKGFRLLSRQVMARWTGGLQVEPNTAPALRLREDLFAHYPFTPEAAQFLRANTGMAVKDPASTQGGGYWLADSRLVFLFTAQMEAALHEHAHGWWEFHGHREPSTAAALIDATIRLAQEPDPAYATTHMLAHDYIHGIPAQRWPGMLVDRNDHEMFAGLASGTMGKMQMLPPYIRTFYQGLFVQPA